MSNETESNRKSGEDRFSPAAKRKRKIRNRILVAVVLVVAGSGYYWYESREVVVEDQPLITAIGIGDIENTIAAAGSLQPRRIVDVGAQVSGQLQKLYVEIGDIVEADELLAEIDAREQENRLESSRANIEALRAQIKSREASLALARANAQRQAQLMAADATSEQEYDSAMNNLASAESSVIQLEKQIEQSLASLAIDEVQLEFTKIYAPIAGTVVSIQMNEGVTLNATQQAPTILQIADLTTMTVETQISEADIGNLTTGMDVYFTTLGGGSRRWYSALRQILPTPETENNVVLYTGLFDVANDDGVLLPGMTTQVYFVTSAARGVLTVPVGALTYVDGPGRQGAAGRLTGGQGGANGGSPGGTRPNGGGFQDRDSIPSAGDFPRGNLSQAGGGDFPRGGAQGGRGGALAGRFSGNDAVAPRNAIVRLVQDNGTIVEREVVVGVTSRVSAEVIAGLAAGDRVVAGIVQANVQAEEGNNNNRDFRVRGFRPF